MLAVIGIIAVMMALIGPAISGFGSTAGRKGAVNVIMNTLEQARVAALESGREVHVIFWRRQFPERDSIMVVRERASDDPEYGNSYEQLTRWMKLPDRVLLHNNSIANVFSGGLGSLELDWIQSEPPSTEVTVLSFNSFGGVNYPASNLILFVAEGVRGADQTEAILRSDSGFFDIITLQRFTGRAALESTVL